MLVRDIPLIAAEMRDALRFGKLGFPSVDLLPRRAFGP